MPILKTILSLSLTCLFCHCSNRQTSLSDRDQEPIQVEESGTFAANETQYCVYKVFEITKGDCPELKSNTTMCVRCPTNGNCPGPAGKKSRFALAKKGNTVCEGTWVRRAIPDACSSCPDGTDNRYIFK